MKYSMVSRGIRAALLIVALMIAISACTKDNPQDQFNPPADHTVSKSGYMHKPGLATPLDNCTSCHGADLKGGTVGVSCYHCHGQKW